MSTDKKYDLKLDYVIKEIIDLYLESLAFKTHGTTAGYIKHILYQEINKILDFLDSERKNNGDLDKKLKKEFSNIVQILDQKFRY